MRILIAGMDGYLGWALAQYLTARGHEVAGADVFHRRKWVEEMGSHSATPIRPMKERLGAFKENFGKLPQFWHGDLTEYPFVATIFREFEPLSDLVLFGPRRDREIRVRHRFGHDATLDR